MTYINPDELPRFRRKTNVASHIICWYYLEFTSTSGHSL